MDEIMDDHVEQTLWLTTELMTADEVSQLRREVMQLLKQIATYKRYAKSGDAA